MFDDIKSFGDRKSDDGLSSVREKSVLVLNMLYNIIKYFEYFSTTRD